MCASCLDTDKAIHCTAARPSRREAGVRNLKKQLEKIYRKAALQLVRMGVVPAAPAEHAAQEAQQVEQAHAEPAAAAEQQQQRQQQHAGVGEHGEHAAPGADHPGSRAAQLAAGAEGAAATAVAEPMIVINRGDLKEYVGQPPYPADKIYADGTPVGEHLRPDRASYSCSDGRTGGASCLNERGRRLPRCRGFVCPRQSLSTLACAQTPTLSPPHLPCRRGDGACLDGAGRQHAVCGGSQRGARGGEGQPQGDG